MQPQPGAGDPGVASGRPVTLRGDTLAALDMHVHVDGAGGWVAMLLHCWQSIGSARRAASSPT